MFTPPQRQIMSISKPESNKNKAVALYHNEAFDNGFYQYFKNIEQNKISQLLNSTDRNVKFDTITYRQLNSWEKEGLLSVQREGREWRRFSIVDAIWVKLVKELREFGMSREQLRATKKSFEFESEKCGVPMPMLEFYTAFVIGAKMPVLILVFKDGVAVPCSFTQYKVAKELVGIDNHIQISLNDLMQDMFPDVDLKPVHKAEMPLHVDEMELLAFLRIGNYEKVEIFYKDGRMQTAEGMQRLEVSALVNDIIKEHKYQKIEVVVDDGRKVSIRRTVKKQINKKG